jgi:hypothetical protein
LGQAHDAAAGHDHDHDDDHGHHHEPPHGGTLVALGDHVAHVELVLNSDAGKLTLYTFDGEAETAVRIPGGAVSLQVVPEGADAPIELELIGVANSLTGETAGDTSEFTVTDDALKGLKQCAVVIPSITIRGATFNDVHFPFPEGNEE